VLLAVVQHEAELLAPLDVSDFTVLDGAIQSGVVDTSGCALSIVYATV
jgi:hypothetical protein